MDEQRGFKINLHDTDPNEGIEPIVPTAKPSGQSHKSAVIFVVLAFLVLGGLVFYLYYNLNNKIRIINNRGSAGIANLSNELDEKLAQFFLQFSADMETSRTMLTDLDTQLKKLSSSVSAISVDKLDKKEMAAITKKIQDDISPLQASVKKIDEQIIGIFEETEQITANLKKIQTGVLNNKKEISLLDAIHIDREYFDKEVKKEREFHQQNMAHASEALFSEIAVLHQQIKDLEKKIEKVKAVPSPQQNPSGKAGDAAKQPSDDIIVPKPGEIIEQELN